MTQRNTILVTLDSLRADHCGFMGYDRNTTPTIDGLAETGLTYENAIAGSVPTGPSMLSAFTGEHCLVDAEDFTRESWQKEFRRRRTLADVLSEAGYSTGAFHANPYASAHFGFDTGFDDFNDFIRSDELKTLTTDSGLTAYLATFRRLLQGEGTNITWEKLYEPIQKWISEVEEPYFLWILLLDTHTPYLPPKSHRHWSDRGTLGLIYDHWTAQRQEWELEQGPIVERLQNAYDDTIRYADDFVSQLQEDTTDDDPIIVIHGDHGEAFGEHGFLRHPPNLHEELVHVPLIIHNSDETNQIQQPVSLRNLPATITDLVNVESDLPGESVAEKGQDWVFSQSFENGGLKSSVRTSRWKLITGENDADELYDLQTDPLEQKNVIDQHMDLAGELRRLLTHHANDQTERKMIHDITTQEFSSL